MNTTAKTIRSSKDVVVGSVVTCTSKEWVDVTVGKEYKVCNTYHRGFDIIDDAGDNRGVPEEFFNDWQVVVDDKQEQIPTNNTKPIKSTKDVKVGDDITPIDDSGSRTDITIGRSYPVFRIEGSRVSIRDDIGTTRTMSEDVLVERWELVVAEYPTQEHMQPIKEFTPKQSLLFTHEQNLMNVWTILDDLDMVVRSWDDMSDDERKGVIEGISLLGNLKMVKLQKSFEELFKATVGEDK